jgi:hypothetical protein
MERAAWDGVCSVPRTVAGSDSPGASAGLVLKRADGAVAIPLEELFALAEKYEPKLVAKDVSAENLIVQ